MEKNYNSAISLLDLNRFVKDVLSKAIPDLIWVRAETSDVRENQNGHCYLEFIQKDDSNKTIVAKSRASIWANTYRLLKAYFESETAQPFVSGLKVLVAVSVDFHELYGFSLTVHNIDPSYTLGDQVRNRIAIIKQLDDEGVLTMNKELELACPANRIAIISSATAAGYEDFCNQLDNNTSGFVFYTKLFSAIMQGDKAEGSILSALDLIYNSSDNFDVVVIIRGGGASSDLSCFDSYLLAASCAQFPLPIITGIGHERDDTVLDIVAHTRAKTPTAVAEFLISNILVLENHLLSMQQQIALVSNQILADHSMKINNIATQFSYLVKDRLQYQSNELDKFDIYLRNQVKQILQQKMHKLEIFEQKLKYVSPENILKQGYTMTLKNNRIVKHSSNLQSGDLIQTVFLDGEISSVVS